MNVFAKDDPSSYFPAENSEVTGIKQNFHGYEI